MKAVIVSGGQIDHEFALQWIHEHSYDLFLAADSGMKFFYENPVAVDIIVGDFDSTNREIVTYFEEQKEVEMIPLNPMKDDTDTEHAIHVAIEKGATEITILGATGTRIDHVLGNIELLGIGLKNQISMELVDKNNRIRLINHALKIEKSKQFGTYVSLIPFTMEVKGLSLKGFQYPLEQASLKSFCALGVSNEIKADTGEIDFEEGLLLVIESRD